jgi:hypothetical protein
MAETYTGQVQNGVVVFDAGVAPPPEGMRVRVEAERSSDVVESPFPEDRMAPTRAWLLAMARDAEEDPESLTLPADLAQNHDHYAHGKPRS